MAGREFDAQLLESVAVRRRRLRDALLHGSLRGQRSVDEQLGKVFGGIVLAAVLCAGCVGWSFVEHRIIHQPTTAVPQVIPSASASR